MKKITLLSLFCSGGLMAQIVNTAPYILTVDELKAWTSTGATASTDLIADVPLAPRFIDVNTQFNQSLGNNMQIAYLPDGMNNFGNYHGEQTQFNLYNFTHWAYLDKFVWFGGTSSQSVQIPSSPWTNAAHRNGVKMLGNIFFSPNVFGGTTATLQNFLEQDGTGHFVAATKLAEIAQYYGFDGWFINEETATNSTVAALMHDFVHELTTLCEANGKEVMWYDAMRLTGAVGWQNRLNAVNSPFVQDDANGDGTFETRVGSSIFINFFWATSNFPNLSRQRAQLIGRSEFEVFTGMDIWPDRNQGDFLTTGNNYMSLLHDASAAPYTSLGLFAPNCIYNHSMYSNFNNDPNDYAAFYAAENKMFAGADQNPAQVDATGWKGYCNWIPETSVIVTDFTTYFNTGHGRKKFVNGLLQTTQDWHDMNQQELLPTWQWAFQPSSPLTAVWDFEDAFSGGNSLKISGNLPANTPYDLKLYKTDITVSNDPSPANNLVVWYKCPDLATPNAKLILNFATNPNVGYEASLSQNETINGWNKATIFLADHAGEHLVSIGLRFASTTAVTDYSLNIGGIQVNSGDLATSGFAKANHKVVLSYPDRTTVTATLDWPVRNEVNYRIADLNGRTMRKGTIAEGITVQKLDTVGLARGTYAIEFSDDAKHVDAQQFIVR